MPKQLMSFVMMALLLGSQNVSAQGVGRSRFLTFEGTLLKYSPHPGYGCGVLYVHQVAKYRVEKVLAGKYVGDEIVVDHPACDEDVFKNIPVGSRVRITVRVWRKYLSVAMYPGIREDENPKMFYVAEVSPMIIDSDE